MLHYLKYAHDEVKRVDNPNTPDRFRSPHHEAGTRADNDRVYWIEKSSKKAPLLTTEGEAIPPGDYGLTRHDGVVLSLTKANYALLYAPVDDLPEPEN